MNRVILLLIFLCAVLINSLAQTNTIDKLSVELEGETDPYKRTKILHEYVWELAYYNPTEAIEPAKESLQLAEKLNDSSLIADSYNRIGLVFDYAGNFDLAEKNYQKAYDIKLNADGEMATDGILNNLGSTYYYLGRYEESMDFYLKSLKIRDLKSDKDDPTSLKPLAQTYNNIALLLKKQKNYKGAIAYYLKALDIKHDLKDSSGIITSKSNLGVLYMEQDSLELAKNIFYSTLELVDDKNDLVSKAMITNNLGLLSSKENDIIQAEKHFNEAILMYDRIEDSYGKAATLINLGSLYLDIKAIERAKSTVESVLEIGRTQGAADVELAALKLLSQIHQTSNPALSLNYLNDYITLKDSINDLKIVKQVNQQAIMYETEKKEAEIELLKKDQVIQLTERAKQDLIIARNRNYLLFLIIGIILIIVLSSALVLYFRSRKEAAEERASKLRIEHQRELDNLRESLAKEIEVEDGEEIHFGMNQDELNQYLLNPLSDRELEVLYKIARGKKNKEIAEELFISVNTVKTHILHIYEKLAVQNRTEAAVKASGMKILK